MVEQTRRTGTNVRNGFLPQARFQQPTATGDTHSQPNELNLVAFDCKMLQIAQLDVVSN